MQPVAHVRATSPDDGDWDCLAENVTIRHGRDDGTAQPEADAATIELLGPPPDGADIGTEIQVLAELGGVEYPRMSGTITDIAIEWDTPDAPVTQIIATGHLARMGHILLAGGTAHDFADDFNRADGPLGAPWITTGVAPVVISSNTLVLSPSSSNACGAYYDTGSSDGTMTFTITEHPVGLGLNVIACRADDGNLIKWQSGIGVTERLTGSDSLIIPSALTFAAGQTLKLTVDGLDVAIFVNGTPAGTGTRSGIPVGSTQWGVHTNIIRVGIDSFALEANPVEMDGDRVNRIIVAAGAPTDAARSDAPGTIHLIALPPDKRTALEIAQEAATDGGGMLWETRDGAVLYADALHRDGTALTLALDPCTIPLEITWVKNLEGLVNDITLTYYEGRDSFEQHVWDADSIAAHGTYATSLDTRISGEGDAITRAARLLFVQAEPAWRVANVGIRLELLAKMGLTPTEDAAYTAAILNLEMNDLVSVVGMPYGSPINPSYLYIEGWTETISFDTWQVDFAVSDYCQTGSAETWDELDSSTTWHTYPGGSDVTWDLLPCHPPPGA